MIVFFDGLVAVEGLDVLLGEHLEEVLVAGAARGVAGAGLLGAEDREVDAAPSSSSLRYGARDLLGAVVVAGRAADPVEDLGVGLVAQTVGMSRPSAQSARSIAEMFHGLPLVSMPLNAPWSSLRELVLHHDFLAAHADDLVDVGNHDRALLFAGAAGGAAPDHVRVEDVGNEIDDRFAHEVAALGRRWEGVNRLLGIARLGLRRRRIARFFDQRVLAKHVLFGGVEVISNRQREVLGRELLAGDVRRAVVAAAPALGAGVQVHDVLVGEVAEPVDAERLFALYLAFEVVDLREARSASARTRTRLE